MKKQFSYLLALFFLLSVCKAGANPFAGEIKGYDAGAFNKMEMQQIDGYQLEKSYVQTLDHVTDDERIYDATIEEDVQRTGVLYNPHFLLERINFEGNTVKDITEEELQHLGLEVIGEDIFFDELLEVCSKVTNLYHSKGYLTSYATVPPQRIVDGVATIKIVESKVGDMNIDGEKWTREWYLRHIIMGKAGLREGDVFNAKNLQRAMKEINREDYVQIQTEVERQPEGDENTVLTLNVRDRFPVNLNFSYDDYGRSYTGAQRVSFLVGMDNLTGLGDKIYGGTILSSGSTGWMAGYSLPVSSYGTRLSFDFSDSHVKLGGPWRPYGVKGNAQSYFFKLTHPLVQTAKSDLFLYTGYDFVNANTSMAFGGPKTYLSDYNLHVWRTGLYGMTDDSYGRWIGNMNVDFGMSGTDKTNLSNADTTFFKIGANATRVQRLFSRSMGVVRIGGQYSPNNLFAAEQMQIGGPYTLRGYQPAEMLGDYGFSGTLEYRTPVPLLDKVCPWLDDRLRLAVFYDYGWVGNNSNAYGNGDTFLHSVGFGTYMNFTDWLTAQIGIGFPLKHENSNNTARFYFSVNSDLDRLIPLRNPEKL